MSQKKRRFKVEEHETVDECLLRMKKEGYRPVRRIEKPLFTAEKVKGKLEYKPISQEIIFDAIKEG